MSYVQKLLAALLGTPAPSPVAAIPPAPVMSSWTDFRVFERRGDALVGLDDQLIADIRVSLLECRSLTSLPAGLKTGSLDLTGCTAIEALPAGLEVAFLDLADCRALESLPADLQLRGGRLNLRNCTKLTALPANMGSVAQLDLQGCAQIRSLPEGLEVTSWIDIGGSGIDRLPVRFAHVGVRRHGVAVAPSEIF